jgi:two-component system OmpR family response regulator
MTPLTDTNEALTVVLVEDDRTLAALTTEFLTRYGVTVHLAGDGREGLELTLRLQPDVVLINLMVPGFEETDLCRSFRRKCDIPIIVLTPNTNEAQRRSALDSGADECIATPFSARELLAQVREQALRTHGRSNPERRHIQCGSLCLDVVSRRVIWEGRDITLTAYEFDLLKVLVERMNRPLARERLIDLVKGSADQAFDRSIDFHISRLRQKLGDDARSPRLLRTVRGVGYMVAAQA